MTANWNQYIVIGEYLLNHISEINADEEMICRCIISRAYYAAYCNICNVATKNGIFSITGKTKDHKEIRNALILHNYYQIASDLNNLRDKRNKADYKNNINFNISDAQYALNLAKKICQNSLTIESIN